jgi:hypothetical protein
VLTERELVAFANEHTTSSAFRLETRQRYEVDSDAGNVARYLAGEEVPSLVVKGPWLEHLARERAQGIRRHRVHVVVSPLSDYLRYECEWGYTYTSAAGEEIYILDVGETPAPEGLPDHDFWIFDDGHVVVMDYDDTDRLRGAEVLPESELPRYRHHRDLALSRAVPFEAYWSAHPQYLRENWLRSADQP